MGQQAANTGIPSVGARLARDRHAQRVARKAGSYKGRCVGSRSDSLQQLDRAAANLGISVGQPRFRGNISRIYFKFRVYWSFRGNIGVTVG